MFFSHQEGGHRQGGRHHQRHGAGRARHARGRGSRACSAASQGHSNHVAAVVDQRVHGASGISLDRAVLEAAGNADVVIAAREGVSSAVSRGSGEGVVQPSEARGSVGVLVGGVGSPAAHAANDIAQVARGGSADVAASQIGVVTVRGVGAGHAQVVDTASLGVVCGVGKVDTVWRTANGDCRIRIGSKGRKKGEGCGVIAGWDITT